MLEKYGRHEETRTPDLYRVKVVTNQPAIGSKGLDSRTNRKNRHKRRNLLPNCYQTEQVGAKGWFVGESVL